MNRRVTLTAILLLLSLAALSCGSYGAYQKARSAEISKDWDTAVVQYEKALEIDPGNRSYQMGLTRARLEASRKHFEKGKTLRSAALQATGADQLRLAQLAVSELQVTVQLDSTNQFAAEELVKATQMINDIAAAANQQTTVDEVKRRAKATAITKAQPPQLNPASNEPISLTFPRETPVKDIYRALGNAFGINILFDQAVKDDRISIELRDVTAQQALERVMQAANHFYKVLDEKTIIVIPDNPQARRDYEDLVIRTFYLSNGDAEQVTNVVRTMIEARNVFPLKALNAITIRDTADKVRIAEKIIEANDKAKAEVVVSVELIQIDLNRVRDIGLALTGVSNGAVSFNKLDQNGNPVIVDNKTVPFTGGSLGDIANTLGSMASLRNSVNFAVPSATYSLLKTLGNVETLASPELRISEGEKATLHIGQRIPVPVTTMSGYNTSTAGNNLVTPYTSFQYQDVGIKVAMEPRVHHNREVTLKLTVEVSNTGDPVNFAGQEQPTFLTRTIESTIRLKDGETNFLAGLIQTNKTSGTAKTPFLGDLPFIGRLFSRSKTEERRTDLVLTMTPHIIRIPDITDEDLAPMWVGTGNNLTFRGVSPRIESQSGIDPFVPGRSEQQFGGAAPVAPAAETPADDAVEDNYPVAQPPVVPQGSAPTDLFKEPEPPTPPPPSVRNPAGMASSSALTTHPVTASAGALTDGEMRLVPRIAPQPSTLSLSPGETKMWNVIGLDLDGLSTPGLVLHYDPRAMDVLEVNLGAAVQVDPALPPVVAVDRQAGTIRVSAPEGHKLNFLTGGDVLTLRVHGGVTGETFLVLDNPEIRDGSGQTVVTAVSGGRARVQ